ncbi:MAG: hypothetical protein EBS99_06535 [Betaproteobacteria bacterium]|nr:hypothetical protein [Betaproteobacteria bacterium]
MGEKRAEFGRGPGRQAGGEEGRDLPGRRGITTGGIVELVDSPLAGALPALHPVADIDRAVRAEVDVRGENVAEQLQEWLARACVRTLYIQKLVAQRWVTSKYLVAPDRPRFSPGSRSARRSKFRIGYFSADFYDHATMQLMAEFLELHDRNEFELFAFSFRQPTDDVMCRRARATFDRWSDVSDLSDAEVADLARSLNLDIAVDLKGLTDSSRPGIFLERVAPVQVAYLGYPGSFGVSAMDYLLADRQLVSADEHEAYAEKIVRLPHTYQVNDRQRFRNIRDDLDRADCGLPADGFVYCCFNNNYKIGPDMFDVWMRLLQKTPGSVLWLLEDSAEAADNLRREAQLRGVDPARLIFAPRVETQRHLERLVLADLFLDTFPYNAHTTASEALWMGLPLLTLRGRSFASRVASSLLHAVELPQLVTTTLEDYEALAWKLSQDAQALGRLRQHLRERGPLTPLFDTPRMTRDIERAYRMMIARADKGLAPDHLDVPVSD